MPNGDLKSIVRDIGLPLGAVLETIATKGKSPGTVALTSQQILHQAEQRRREEEERARQRAMQERIFGLQEKKLIGKKLIGETGQREALQRAAGELEDLTPSEQAAIAGGLSETVLEQRIKPAPLTIQQEIERARQIREGVERPREKQKFEEKKSLIELQTQAKKDLASHNAALKRFNQKQDRKADKEAKRIDSMDDKLVKTTNAQETAALYGRRMEQAHNVFADLENEGVDLAGFGESVRGKLPGFLKGGPVRRYDQAKRNFINAVLRRESGAVISQQEFANADQQYFTGFGDDSKTIEQKRANRQLAIDGLRSASGAAWDKFGAPTTISAPPPTIPQTEPGTAPVPQIQIPTINTQEEYNALQPGATYIDAADGKTYTKGR
jgi:hypothetical protein